MWLGLSKQKRDVISGLPTGYEETQALKKASKTYASLPPFIRYPGNKGIHMYM